MRDTNLGSSASGQIQQKPKPPKSAQMPQQYRDWEQAGHMKWERNLSLALAVLMLIGGVIWAYFFITSSPNLGPRTPVEKELADKWIRVLFTVLWIGFALISVVLMIFLSTVIGKTGAILEKINLRLKKKR